MCGLNKRKGQLTADGRQFSVLPATIPVQEKKNASGLTPSELAAILANPKKVSEDEKMDPHTDRGYHSP